MYNLILAHFICIILRGEQILLSIRDLRDEYLPRPEDRVCALVVCVNGLGRYQGPATQTRVHTFREVKRALQRSV